MKQHKRNVHQKGSVGQIRLGVSNSRKDKRQKKKAEKKLRKTASKILLNSQNVKESEHENVDGGDDAESSEEAYEASESGDMQLENALRKVLTAQFANKSVDPDADVREDLEVISGVRIRRGKKEKQRMIVENEVSVRSTNQNDETLSTRIDQDDMNVTPALDNTKVKLSKGQKKRIHSKELKAAKQAIKDAQPKPPPQEPRMSSSIVLPKRRKFDSTLDSPEKLLEAVRARLAETTRHTLQIRPVPRSCPPGLLRDLCPLAVAVRFPLKASAGYAFLTFRNVEEMHAAEKMLVTKKLKGKPIRCFVCSNFAPKVKTDASVSKAEWCDPSARQISDFNLHVLHVTGLPRSTTRMDLAQTFRQATSLHMPTHDDGSCQGTCRLIYRSRDAALEAFEYRHKTFIHGSPIYVNFALRSTIKKPSRDRENTIGTSVATKHSQVDATSEVIPTLILNETCTTDAATPNLLQRNEFDQANTANPFKTVGSRNSEFRQSRAPMASTLTPPTKSHPKLVQKHQLKQKGKSTTRHSSGLLSSLLGPPVAKKTKSRRSTLKKSRKTKRH